MLRIGTGEGLQIVPEKIAVAIADEVRVETAFTEHGRERVQLDDEPAPSGEVGPDVRHDGRHVASAEIESALVAHAVVAEAAVVGYPHDIKGEGIYAYVTLVADAEPTDELRAELRQWVRKEIGPIATPDLLQWAPGLPKTRSGKIMRRILRKIAADDYGDLGDTSTLAEPDVVAQLIDNRMNR